VETEEMPDSQVAVFASVQMRVKTNASIVVREIPLLNRLHCACGGEIGDRPVIIGEEQLHTREPCCRQ
jgi:hypothetical protein